MVSWFGLAMFLTAVVLFLMGMVLFQSMLNRDLRETQHRFYEKSMKALQERNELAHAIQAHRAVIKVPTDHDTVLYQELRKVMGAWS